MGARHFVNEAAHRVHCKESRTIIPRFTFTVVDEFRRLLHQFSINFHEILHTLFSIHVVTTLKVSRSFDKYFKS